MCLHANVRDTVTWEGPWGAGAADQPCSPLQFFASMLTYPFVLVSNLMAVNNCG